MLTHINDGISYNERLMLRAAFDLPATSPFSGFDPTSGITMIQFTSRYGRVLEAFLLPTVYGGPRTSGWCAAGSCRHTPELYACAPARTG
jgi:hypothetical protein